MRKPNVIKMNGLRVYINKAGTHPFGGDGVFYSRRAAGPFYYWRYEDGLGRWRVSRVCLSELAVKALSKASWQALPRELKAKMIEHYLD
ncbi:MAG TPA: hypothetical protein VEV81_02080 [Pyrinomonadaceae bacterium]|nr:hypothetical protein [Pyrinomonadaceae bacterium]